MNLFYVLPSEIHQNKIMMKGSEASHITRVMRYRVGDTVYLTDGRGHLYNCEIEAAGKNQLTARIVSSKKEELVLPRVILCMGMIKKRDRLEFAIEKAVELGADQLIFFVGDNSERSKAREDRLQGIALSAMKQSKRLYLPEISVKPSLKAVLDLAEPDIKIFVADEERTEESPIERFTGVDNFMLIVGPEGGFSKRERNYLQDLSTATYSLGNKRLRAETAAIVMVDRFKNLSK